MRFRSNFSMLGPSGDRKWEFLSERWNFGSINGVVQEFRTLVFVWRMRIYFFDICEIGRIDIFGAGRIRPVSLWELLIPIIGDMDIVSDLSWSVSTENGLAVGLSMEAQNFDGSRCGEDSQIRIWNCFELGNVGWIDKSLGCLEKKHPGYFVQNEKKEEECS